jgi:hypothetical protein
MGSAGFRIFFLGDYLLPSLAMYTLQSVQSYWPASILRPFVHRWLCAAILQLMGLRQCRYLSCKHDIYILRSVSTFRWKRHEANIVQSFA